MNKMHSYSYSEISTAYKCNQLFKYLYLDKLKPNTPDSGDMKFGTALHMGLNVMLSGEGDGVEYFTLYWDAQKTLENAYTRFKWSELREQGIVFLERFKRLHMKHFKPFFMEKREYGNIGDIRVEGTPDFVGTYKDVMSLVDFKTSATRYNPEKADISEQMHLYAYLVEQNNPDIKIEQLVYVVFIKGTTPSIQVVVSPINRDRMKVILENIRLQGEELNARIEKDKWTKNFNGCGYQGGYCQFPERCYK